MIHANADVTLDNGPEALRADFEAERPEGLKYNAVVRKGKDGGMTAEKAQREEPPKELADIAAATLEQLEGARA